ncbi:MAG TPA: DUF3048 C-terminal domain-containing protein [Candidatus Limiplasma sp.]|nr:DUF3048 C-terminal domain-containing protein [Candidatus Limiplasma sp.]
MKKFAFLCTLCAVLAIICCALADGPEYTLSVKNSTVLQNIADRNISVPNEVAIHDVIAGESPVTGLPWEGRYMPVLVQIGNSVSNATVNGYAVQATGIAKRTPWGIQYADIIYEEIIHRGGYTRFTMLFSDCFAQGEPAGGVGPVRSCRIGPVLLRESWQGALVYGGGFLGSFRQPDGAIAQLFSQTGTEELGILFNIRSTEYYTLGYHIKNVKAPSNYSVDLLAVYDLIPETYSAAPHPFLFGTDTYTADTYPTASIISLDWGYKYNISHFIYNEDSNTYTRYCGAGIKPKKWVEFASFSTAEDRSDEHKQALDFTNVIIQRVEYVYENDSANKPVVQSIGQGSADIFINGRYIAGYWVCSSLDGPTVYYDDQGNELCLNRGKTYIAHFPAEGLCTFTDWDNEYLD